MLIESIQTRNSLLEDGLTSNVNERVQYTASTGIALLNTANPNLDGSGTLALVLKNTVDILLKNITIKAIGNTTRGMVRLFIANASTGGANLLIDEIEIPAVIQSSTTPAFEISYDLNYYLTSAGTGLLKASTQNAESFIVTAQALEISYP